MASIDETAVSSRDDGFAYGIDRGKTVATLRVLPPKSAGRDHSVCTLVVLAE